MEELLTRHRKEQRDLQSQITQKKKAASKKTRKSVNDECTRLEADLKARHAAEVAELEGTAPTDPLEQDDPEALLDAIASANGTSDLEKSTAALSIGDAQKPEVADSANQPRKQNRQKARLARRAAEQEAVAAQAAEEATNLPDQKKRERDRMIEEFKNRGLSEHEVAANGHCMYLAMADQMKRLEQPLEIIDSSDTSLPDFKKVRRSTADYISKHPDDFAPFLEEPLEDYVRKIRDTAEWGGQLELMALAKTYSININVLQGDGRVERIEGSTGTDKPEAWLAYYRHGFGLGEHYNSLRKSA